MIVEVYCKGCKNFRYFGCSDDGEEVTGCELGRYREHTEAENNNWITECDYYE